MNASSTVGIIGLTALVVVACCEVVEAQTPDHPIIVSVYADPPGVNDGPVGRDPSNQHQEYIKLYLPTAGDLALGLNASALRLTLYEVEGDTSSSGYTLVNYRIDLPPLDLNSADRPPSGILVLGWVDYENSDAGTCAGSAAACSVFNQDCADLSACEADPPTALLGTPNTRVALVDGGVTATTDYKFVALNGAQFSGTTNFLVPDAVSLIHMPNEARSGMIQNGSGAYLLVNRDDAGYVELYDDKDTTHIPPGSADPAMAAGNVLLVSCLLDGFAANDDGVFDVTQQPYSVGDPIDLADVLPNGGAYSLLIPQIPEDDEHGYMRLYLDVHKTTEDGLPLNEDPVADALDAYRTIFNLGPWFPSPARATLTTSPAELAVADASLQLFDVLAGTTGRPGVICANVGGDFGMQALTTPGPSSDPGLFSFAIGELTEVAQGQTLIYPNVAGTVAITAAHGGEATSVLEIAAGIANVGDPAVVNPSDSTTGTYRVLNPVTGLDAAGLPFQATAFVALQGLPDGVGVTNEFIGTSLANFVAANLGVLVDDERHNGALLLDPLTDLSDPVIAAAMEDAMPDTPLLYINLPSPAGLDNLVTTILTSAEVVAGNATYDDNFNVPPPFIPPFTGVTVRAIELTIGETRTTGGIFIPTERVHYVDPRGFPGAPESGLANVNTTRGFELALLDSNVQNAGTLETGATDDFGLVVEVGRTRAGASVVPGEFVFLSYTGGLEGADIDTLDVPPHGNQTVLIYIDLDPLDAVLGCETIVRLFVIDGSGSSDVNIIEAFSLNVDAACAAPTVATPPVSQSICESDPVNFSVIAVGAEPFAYQWRKDGVEIPGATADTYTIASVTAMDAGNYDVVVTNACSAVTSPPATLTIPTPPSVVSQPQSTSACPGQSASFTAIASGGGSLTYQWRIGTTNIVDGGTISGANTPTLTIFPVSASDEAADYNCVMSGPCPPDAVSDNVSLTVTDCGPVVLEALGSRYLSVTPELGPDSIALLITSADEPCLSVYVQADGTLDASAVFQTPAQWGTTTVTDVEIIPATTYAAQAESVGGGLSASAAATTFAYGDVDNNGAAGFLDILLQVRGFKGDFTDASLEAMDINPCLVDGGVGFLDMLWVVKAFKDEPYVEVCPEPCP